MSQGHKRSYQTSSWSIYTKYQVMISACMFQRRTKLAIKQARNWSILNANAITLQCNQSGVPILTLYFRYLMLQVIVNWRNYKFNLCIYKISNDRYNVVKLSPHKFKA